MERGLDRIEFLAKAPLEMSLKDLSHDVGFGMGTARLTFRCTYLFFAGDGHLWEREKEEIGSIMGSIPERAGGDFVH